MPLKFLVGRTNEVPVVWRGAFWIAFSLVWLVYAVPYIQARFFPSVMDQLVGVLDRTSFIDCEADMDRPRPTLLKLGLLDTTGERVVGEIYQHELTLREDRTSSHYRAHAVNIGVDGRYYATGSQLYVSADALHVIRVEVKTCDRLVDSAEARSNDEVLQEQCEVPIRQVMCEARAEVAR